MAKQLIGPTLVRQLRSIQVSLMPDLCDVEHPPSVTAAVQMNADGSRKTAAPVVTLNVPCRVSAMGAPVEDTDTGQIVSIGNFAVSLPWDTAVTVEDRILYQGLRYEIISISTPKSFQASVRCICKKVASI